MKYANPQFLVETNWLEKNAAPPTAALYQTIVAASAGVLVASTLKSANVNPDASQMGGGVGFVTVGH